MNIGTISKAKTGTAFPWKDVEARLRASLADLVKSNAEFHEIKLPSALPDLYAAGTQIDSLDVVDILCEVDKILGFKLNDSIVKAGGYESINQAIEHVMPRIQSAWQKHESKGSKK